MSALAVEIYEQPPQLQQLTQALSASVRMEFVIAIGQLRNAVVLPIFQSARTRDALSILHGRSEQTSLILVRLTRKLAQAIRDGHASVEALDALQQLSWTDLQETAARLWGAQAGRDAEAAEALMTGATRFARTTLWDAPQSTALVEGPPPAVWRRMEPRIAFMNCVCLAVQFADMKDVPRPRATVMRALLRHLLSEARSYIADLTALVGPVQAGTLALSFEHRPVPQEATDAFMKASFDQMFADWKEDLELLG